MKQQGFTLTELLVSLVISSILLLGISTFLIAGKSSWQTQLRLTSSQEIERFTVLQLRRAIRQAYAIEMVSDEKVLVLTYAAEEGSRNCLGQLQESGSSYINRFTVSDDQLRCNGHSLISGVKSVRFAYGVDKNDDGRIEASEYDSAPDSCCLVRSVEFEFRLSGINEDQQPMIYSAALRRY
ncbi:prepilin-type N-terminal cleavage/methylation domain-containing protein [Nitrincola schmidtii]|uniref:prepilin-type N-terminal cleavage/methylation domain-containing protein n=1 Tax=Nitrincola schmidtii TaxID=1730894 RepID=UPI00124D3065|nr:prepilin-type N-terminal cleavage/methylation domain-containing protein [Nitrincola schmidtii]